MRIPRIRLTVRQMMIAVAVVGVGSWAFGQYQRLGFYYLKGWWEAECELWRGNVTIYSGGRIDLFPLTDTCHIDENTGLLLHWAYGCRPDQCDLELVKGHNDRVAQYIRWHGLPRNTLKPWEKELFHLKPFFDNRSPPDSLARLVANGPRLVSPDGRNSVRLVARLNADGSMRDREKVVIAAGNVALDDWYERFGRGESHLLWGPEGSRLAAIRSTSGAEEHYEAYDLRTGRFLREETWLDGQPRDEVILRNTASGVNPYDPQVPPAPSGD